MRVIIGMLIGATLMISIQANAGIISHVAAYEYGKHVARQEAKHAIKNDCTCPPVITKESKP